MHPPVVEHLRHMGRAAHLLNEAEEEVVVLAAVTLRALAAHFVPQGPLEHGQMADVVAAEQVVRGVIGLEVGHEGALDALGKERLVAVDKAVRLALGPQLQNGLAHGVHGMRGQNVVVVGEGKVFAAGQPGGGVGVGRNALVFDFFVYDVLIFRLIFLYDTLHAAVGGVGSVREAELAVGGRLVHEGIQKLPQVVFRRIIQRGEDGNGRKAAVGKTFPGVLGPLGFQHLFRGQVAGLFAEKAALDKARAPHQHGAKALVAGELDGIARQLFGAFQSYIHLMPRPGGWPCRPRRPSRYRRSSSDGRGSAMPPCCTSARSARWSGRQG